MPPIDRRVTAWAKKSLSRSDGSIRRTATNSAAAPAITRWSSEAAIHTRPTTLWSPVPRIDARPVAAGVVAVGCETAGAAAGASSVTVMQAPGGADGWLSGI